MSFDTNLARTARYLLAHTFIVRGKKPASLYDFCREERNKKRLNECFEPFGYYVEVNPNLGYARLIDTSDALNEMEFGRTENLNKFTSLQTYMIAVLWRYYVEHMGEPEVIIRAVELRKKCLDYGGMQSKKEFSEALKLLKYYNLIECKDPTMNEFPIIILPSILGVFNEVKFKDIFSADYQTPHTIVTEPEE